MIPIRLKLAFCLSALFVWSCSGAPSGTPTLDELGELFVKLGLELGEYDSNYIDSYIGPDEWAKYAENSLRPKEKLAQAIANFLADLEGLTPTEHDEVIRHKALLGKVRAMDTRVRMVNGESFSFAEEARLLYDVVLPTYDFAEFDRTLEEISELIPGDDDLAKRVDSFQTSMAIPADKLSIVFDRAIEECKRRTLEYIPLPPAERFQLEYVTGKNWPGYLEYLGNHESLMQINVDFPITTDRAVELACHEGYPGHHVYNLLVEQRFLKEKGWNEFLLAPIFAPAMLVHEGSAMYGVGLAFPEDESYEFQRNVLIPLAGLDPEKAATLDKLIELKSRLNSAARAATAQLYLDGRISREEAIEQLQKYRLNSRVMAESSLRFIETYRSYVINYSLGTEIVRAYIEGQADDQPSRWEAFDKLLTELPSAGDMMDSE